MALHRSRLGALLDLSRWCGGSDNIKTLFSPFQSQVFSFVKDCEERLRLSEELENEVQVLKGLLQSGLI